MDRMTSLEKRVDQLLGMMKRLKDDKAKLKKELVTLEKELSKRDREASRWVQDRQRLRARVEHILSETGNILGSSREESPEQPRMVSGDGWKPGRRDWGAGKGGDA